MTLETASTKSLKVGELKVEIYPDKHQAGMAAAQNAADTIRDLALDRDTLAVIFATGASQFDTLDCLSKIADVPWAQVLGFHMDEYVHISSDHPASFRRYLRERLTTQVAMRQFLEIDGSAADPAEVARTYAAALRSAQPQLCLLGIGENGHLAFNDPDVANFSDPLDAKVVKLDPMCRQQQTAEGWFASADEVPAEAITLTIPTLLRVRKLILSVPGARKAKIVRRALEEPISTSCPATILRTHPDVTLYLDRESASELDGLFS